VFHYNRTGITGTLHEDQYTCLIISRSVLLRMRNVSDKICRGYHKKTFCVQQFSFFENSAVYEIMWKNIVEQSRPQMTMWRMRTACSITIIPHSHTICNN